MPNLYVLLVLEGVILLKLKTGETVKIVKKS